MVKLNLFFILVFLSVVANAQTDRKPAISLGPELNVPQRSGYTIGYGASANFELPVAASVNLMVAAGYHRYNHKNFGFNNYIKPGPDYFTPLKAGVKYYPDAKLYLAGELGTVFNNKNNSGSTSNLFAYSLGTGFLLPVNSEKTNHVDIGLRFENWSQNRLRQFAIRVAYRFHL